MKFLACIYVRAKHVPRFAFRWKVWNKCVNAARQKILCKLLNTSDPGAMCSWMLVVTLATPVVDNVTRKSCCVRILFAKETVDPLQHKCLGVVYVAQRSFPLDKCGAGITEVAAEIDLLVHVTPPQGQVHIRAGP